MAFKRHIQIDKEIYLDRLKDPKEWFRMAYYQKEIGLFICNSMIMNKDFLMKIQGANLKDEVWNEYVVLKCNSYYHFALGIENGLKGLLILNHPEEITTQVNGKQVLLRKIGNSKHDLYSLAEKSGLLDVDRFKHSVSLQDLLQFMSEIMLWFGRYPIGLSNISDFAPSRDTPFVTVFGWHMLDVIEPVFNYFDEISRGGCSR